MNDLAPHTFQTVCNLGGDIFLSTDRSCVDLSMGVEDNAFMNIQKIMIKFRIYKWKREGAKIGDSFQLERNSYLDSSFPWLIEIGNNVTLAPDVQILAHDGSTKKQLGYSKVGKVYIGDNVFIGSKSIILPNTTIGENSIIGAGSIVSGDVPEGSVVAGVPGKVLQMTVEYTQKNVNRLKNGVTFDESYTKRGKITKQKKEEMKTVLSEIKNGFVV